jgi:hypothetical protein
MFVRQQTLTALCVSAFLLAACVPSLALEVTYKPYIQPGDGSAFGGRDVKVIAWQTDEAVPNASAYKVTYGLIPKMREKAEVVGRVVDDYLSADPSLPVPATALGAHVNYYATLKGLKYDRTYYYRVTGPGLPEEGFEASFPTRKQGDYFSFQVVGDEGFFPTIPGSDPKRVVNWEARIVHEMFEVDSLSIPGASKLPKPDLALNTGDNVYNNGTEGDYRDFWMPVWNNDVSSNETGAPYTRHIPYYIVAGNHDLGGTGVTVNMVGTADAGRYSGNSGGGDALQYFNNYYFPLNGPLGVDVQHTLDGDRDILNGFYFQYQGVNYDSPAAIKAFRASTTVNTGKGEKRQIDHMGNFSFDQGNAHFVFLDGNPHLFNGLLSYEAVYSSPQSNFPEYPNILRDWLIEDLDSSSQPWKIVVWHHPPFSSSNGTIRNFQMRRIAKLLEDHGVNVVFNGHAHNYQRTYPLRALASVADIPTSEGDPAVTIDHNFNGSTETVPDGVIYLVEGAGGRDSHDSGGTSPRGNSNAVDEDDSAIGTFTFPNGLAFPNGPASWLDDHLTNAEMAPFIPNAGKGPKITIKFKGKVFSFADVVVKNNQLTLYQISEPLQDTSSATVENPAPYGTDYQNRPINDPIPDTLIDPRTGEVVSEPAVGRPALLDKFTVTKPVLWGKLTAMLRVPPRVEAGKAFSYHLRVSNNSGYPLNGTQAVLTLPKGATVANRENNAMVQVGDDLIVTLGRLEAGQGRYVRIDVTMPAESAGGAKLAASAVIRSGTAMPIHTNKVLTRIVN